MLSRRQLARLQTKLLAEWGQIFGIDQVANLDRFWVCPLSGEQRAPFARRKENGSVRIRSRERRADRRLHGRHKLQSVGGEHTAKIRRDIAGHGVVSLAHQHPGSSSAASE